ncbi:MAG: hypothetical protein M3290_04425 [Actinomycetota bacterium]|nr:hypothetical protein [Actinomycetota bacterium]
MSPATRDQIELLDDALSGLPADGSVIELTQLAEGLRGALEVSTPPAPGARALFIEGASALAKKRRSPRLLVPSIAMGLLIVAIATLSRTALPGTPLYQVRKVLASVDLAPSAQHEVDARIDRARFQLSLPESRLPDNPAAALAAANVALEQLGQARSFLGDISAAERAKDIETIAVLEAKADSVIAEASTKEHGRTNASPESDERSGGAGSEHSGNAGRGPGSPGSDRGKGSHETGDSHRSGSSDQRGSNSGSDRGSADHGSDDAHSGDSQGSDHAVAPSPTARGGHDTGTDHSGKDTTSGDDGGSQTSGNGSTTDGLPVGLDGTGKGGDHSNKRPTEN